MSILTPEGRTSTEQNAGHLLDTQPAQHFSIAWYEKSVILFLTTNGALASWLEFQFSCGAEASKQTRGKDMVLTIPIAQEQIRSFQDPNRSSIRILHALVRVLDWPDNVPLDPDPRVPKEKGPVVKRISASLGRGDGRFHLLNRGITLSVKKAEFDNQVGTLRLFLPEDESYGIIDGGHTDFAIKSTVATHRSAGTEETLGNQYVHIEILSRIENDLADIAEARNYSAQLKSWTLASYREDFKWFLDALGVDFCRSIKVSENDPEPVGILDLIQVMCAVNPSLYEPTSTSVNEAYKNAGKCLQYFVQSEDVYKFKDLKPICKDIVRLYDYIRYK
ncbi:MAG: AIPR family protein, partial [Terracidiphilus sp.]